MVKLTTPIFTALLLVVLGLAGIVLPACAQDSGSFYAICSKCVRYERSQT